MEAERTDHSINDNSCVFLSRFPLALQLSFQKSIEVCACVTYRSHLFICRCTVHTHECALVDRLVLFDLHPSSPCHQCTRQAFFELPTSGLPLLLHWWLSSMVRTAISTGRLLEIRSIFRCRLGSDQGSTETIPLAIRMPKDSWTSSNLDRRWIGRDVSVRAAPFSHMNKPSSLFH